MNRKNAEKCMIPAMSVSANSTKRVVWKGVGIEKVQSGKTRVESQN
jgi:hypothetical protein